MNYGNFIDKHKGETIIVCGCGRSLNEFKDPENYITIGVNDIQRAFTPNYLVLLNNNAGFKGDRWKYVKNSKASFIFTQLDPKTLRLGGNKEYVKISLGSHGKTRLDDKNIIDYTTNSPYVACIIAYHMGAKKIGLIGVDFTNHHFFGKTGRHSLAGRLSHIKKEYKELHKAMKSRGVEFFNLGSTSLVDTIPQKTFKQLRNEKRKN